MKPLDGKTAFILGLVGEALREFGPEGPEADVLLAAAAGPPPTAVTGAIQKQPNQADGYLARGEWYGRRGLWRKAAEDFGAVYLLRPEVYTGSELRSLSNCASRNCSHSTSGGRIPGCSWNPAGVDRGSRPLPGPLSGVGRPRCRDPRVLDADRTLKVCCLVGTGPGRRPGPDRPAGRGRRVGRPLNRSLVVRPGQGMYEYRVGRYDAAMKICRANRAGIKAGGGPSPAIAMVRRRGAGPAPLRGRGRRPPLAGRREKADRREVPGSRRR